MAVGALAVCLIVFPTHRSWGRTIREASHEMAKACSHPNPGS